ncbi:M61 family metallopeptidase [Agaribacter marinus]|uniref:Peptidase M61 n=1 Tax=Agaribacter marinus TaxID=1431249 RepID=A0AA37SUX0_9ALTE|nr:PDZ domain-containing protein [Agaribacter marinus]GLR70341.1 peptidase M61 [Agaribacter marinus]
MTKAKKITRDNIAVKYKVSPTSLAEHIFSVSLSISANELRSLTLSLPAWIPGSYMIRDFARNILDISCTNEKVHITPIDKQTWHVSNKSDIALGDIQINYHVFAFDLSVRSAYINDEYAFFNGTSVFLKVHEFENNKHIVTIDKTDTMPWAEIVTSMPCDDTSSPSDNLRVFSCDNYCSVIDHPVLIGKCTRKSFDVDGVTFHLVFTGEHDLNMSRMCNDLAPICRHHMQLFGDMPVDEYWFITLLCKDGFGGLEHSASTILQYAVSALPKSNEQQGMDDGYRDFLSLCSHELFHLWHVKRNKPDVYVQPDLSQEVYSPQLWIYEGFTSLYDDLTLARTGIISPEGYCQILGQNITRLLRNPGRHKQSVAESSFYAWTKFYKQDASSVNHIVSYYLKGGIVALALDIRIRELSKNTCNLDTVMQEIWKQYGAKDIGTPNTLIHDICRDSLDMDIAPFLDTAVETTMDLPLSQLLNALGLHLHLRARSGNDDKGGKPAEIEIARDFGALSKDQPVGTMITQVLEGRAACDAGLQLQDNLIAINNVEVNSKNLGRELNALHIGSECDLCVLRDGRLLHLKMPVREAIKDTCYITIDDADTFKKWLTLL